MPDIARHNNEIDAKRTFNACAKVWTAAKPLLAQNSSSCIVPLVHTVRAIRVNATRFSEMPARPLHFEAGANIGSSPWGRFRVTHRALRAVSRCRFASSSISGTKLCFTAACWTLHSKSRSDFDIAFCISSKVSPIGFAGSHRGPHNNFAGGNYLVFPD